MLSVKGVVFLVSCVIISVSAQNDEQDVPSETSERNMMNCLSTLDFQCVKLRTLANIYTLMKTRSLNLFGGLKLEYSGSNVYDADMAARSLVHEEWGNIFFNVVPRLLNGLSLRINFHPEGSLRVYRSMRENGLFNIAIESNKAVAQGRNEKEHRHTMALVLYGGFYSIIIAIGMGIIKLLALKGLLVGKVALVMSVMTGIAKMLGDKNKSNQSGGLGQAEGLANFEKNVAESMIYNTISNNWRRYWVPPKHRYHYYY